MATGNGNGQWQWTMAIGNPCMKSVAILAQASFGTTDHCCEVLVHHGTCLGEPQESHHCELEPALEGLCGVHRGMAVQSSDFAIEVQSRTSVRDICARCDTRDVALLLPSAQVALGGWLEPGHASAEVHDGSATGAREKQDVDSSWCRR